MINKKLMINNAEINILGDLDINNINNMDLRQLKNILDDISYDIDTINCVDKDKLIKYKNHIQISLLCIIYNSLRAYFLLDNY